MIDDHLIELRFYVRDDLVEHIAKREIRAVTLEKCPANRADRAVVKNHLLAEDANVVGPRALRGRAATATAAAAAATTTSATAGEKTARSEFRIRPRPVPGGIHLGQAWRANLDNDALAPFDFLNRPQNIRVLFQSRQHGPI